MRTTIVIPCYNEAGRLNRDAFLHYLSQNEEVSFLFVNDGSKDNTLNVLKSFAEQQERVHYLDLQPNGGKAEAVRRGMLHAAEHFESDCIGFWDADLATPLNEIDSFLAQMCHGNFDIVTGLRLMRLGANVKRKPLRHYLGRCFATCASIVLKLPVYDTQCGAKLYKSGIVPELFGSPFLSKWLFDVELLARYINGYGRDRAVRSIYEYPVFEWVDVGGSQLKIKDFFKGPYELWRIKKRYRI